jgi:hypothetical protein
MEQHLPTHYPLDKAVWESTREVIRRSSLTSSLNQRKYQINILTNANQECK